ncbi:MAG: low molecular weight protein arginine phosphatase [Clostridia bacterium]
MKITFVCTGNTCRSPMAEGILQDKLVKLGKEDIEVASAGLECGYGSPVAVNSQQILDEREILFSHTSQPLTRKLVDESELIVTMTQNHAQIVDYYFPDARAKVACASEFIGEEIADPYGRSLEVYRATAVQIDKLIDKIIDNVVNKNNDEKSDSDKK